METPNISLNHPVGHKPAARTSEPNIRQYRKPDGNESQFYQKREANGSLELYGGTGKVRTEQPAVRGHNIDITV